MSSSGKSAQEEVVWRDDTNIFFCRNAKKTQERIENMKVELDEAKKREAEIEEEKEIVKNDCKLSSEKATELKVLICSSC